VVVGRLQLAALMASILLVGFVALSPGRSDAADAHLIGRDYVGTRSTTANFAGSGCGVAGTVALQLPRGAVRIRQPHQNIFLHVGSYLAGPDGFVGPNDTSDPRYARIDSFTTHDSTAGPQAVFTADASPRWCAGWTGDPSSRPIPASEQSQPQLDPTYHAGWRAAGAQPIVYYVLRNRSLRSIDPKNRIRSRPPSSMAISHRFPLYATAIRWRQWGEQTANGRGLLSYQGRRLGVNLQFYNAELGGDPQGLPHCPTGQIFYQNLYVQVPAWGKQTTYAVDQHCRRAFNDNSAGDLRPPGG
jgi:hypothetical protein